MKNSLFMNAQEVADLLGTSKAYAYKLIQKLNEGVSSARNAGLDAAQGEYIIFVDGDDIASTAAIALNTLPSGIASIGDLHQTSVKAPIVALPIDGSPANGDFLDFAVVVSLIRLVAHHLDTIAKHITSSGGDMRIASSGVARLGSLVLAIDLLDPIALKTLTVDVGDKPTGRIGQLAIVVGKDDAGAKGKSTAQNDAGCRLAKHIAIAIDREESRAGSLSNCINIVALKMAIILLGHNPTARGHARAD